MADGPRAPSPSFDELPPHENTPNSRGRDRTQRATTSLSHTHRHFVAPPLAPSARQPPTLGTQLSALRSAWIRHRPRAPRIGQTWRRLTFTRAPVRGLAESL